MSVLLAGLLSLQLISCANVSHVDESTRAAFRRPLFLVLSATPMKQPAEMEFLHPGLKRHRSTDFKMSSRFSRTPDALRYFGRLHAPFQLPAFLKP